jgi:hypothetical protein
MKAIDILIAVDTASALASGNLSNNVYLIDTNKYIGSWNEGQAELHTVCQDAQIVSWRVEPIDTQNEVAISQFTGQMIDGKICVPVKQGIPGAEQWEGRIETQGATGRYQYSVVLVIDGKSMTFDPFLDVQ